MCYTISVRGNQLNALEVTGMYFSIEFTVDGISMSTVVKAVSIVQAEHMIDTYWCNLGKKISIDSVKEYHLLTNDEI